MSALKPWRWMLLTLELALFVIILIHPDVDLPEFTFHSGTAPLTAKYRFSVPPMAVSNLTASPILITAPMSGMDTERPEPGTVRNRDMRLSLFCTLIC
jgi:hypothetical protein